MHHLSASSENKSAHGGFCAVSEIKEEWHVAVNGLQTSLLLTDAGLAGFGERRPGAASPSRREAFDLHSKLVRKASHPPHFVQEATRA